VVQTIISGGQTGADRAALDFAIKNGMPYGGWCPQKRLAEDGPIGGLYQLKTSVELSRCAHEHAAFAADWRIPGRGEPTPSRILGRDCHEVIADVRPGAMHAGE
jgi:hypothetical protein